MLCPLGPALCADNLLDSLEIFLANDLATKRENLEHKKRYSKHKQSSQKTKVITEMHA